MLDFMSKRAKYAVARNRHGFFENPKTSDIWTASSLSTIPCEYKSRDTCMCAFSSLPDRERSEKLTSLKATFPLQKSTRSCHCWYGHVVLQGFDKEAHMTHTAAAALYSHSFCTAILRDFCQLSDGDHVLHTSIHTSTSSSDTFSKNTTSITTFCDEHNILASVDDMPKHIDEMSKVDVSMMSLIPVDELSAIFRSLDKKVLLSGIILIHDILHKLGRSGNVGTVLHSRECTSDDITVNSWLHFIKDVMKVSCLVGHINPSCMFDSAAEWLRSDGITCRCFYTYDNTHYHGLVEK